MRPKGLFEWEGLVVDARSGRVTYKRSAIALQQNPLRILLALVRSPDGKLTREQLYRAVWEEGIYVDFQHGLNTAMNRLRRALRKHTHRGDLIVTVSRTGYRLVTPAIELRKTDSRWVRVRPAAQEGHSLQLH